MKSVKLMLHKDLSHSKMFLYANGYQKRGLKFAKTPLPLFHVVHVVHVATKIQPIQTMFFILCHDKIHHSYFR